MHPKLKYLALMLVTVGLLGGCATTPSGTGPYADTNAADRADYNDYNTVTSHAGADQDRPDTPATTQQATKPSTAGTGQNAANAQTHVVELDPIGTPGGLWDRIRHGYQMTPYPHKRLVRKWVQFYITHLDHLLGAARRARPFLWHIVEAIDERGMPMELALLPIVESGFNPAAESYAGAAGLWQFMPMTADRFGLDQNWWYDGRNAVLPSTRAALDYLSWLHGRFDNWLLALAAYNAGAGRVSQAVNVARAQGRPTDFWHLNLPTQTENFVPKLLALREILRAPQRFAINWPQLPNKQLTASVAIPTQVELDRLAEMIGISTTKLSKLNPAYRRWATAPSASHEVLVPIDKAHALQVALANADPDSLITRHRSYSVSRGDTLYGIAHHFGTTVARLRLLNGLNGNVIHPGDQLLLPRGNGHPAPPVRVTHTVHSGESLWAIAQQYDTTVAKLRRWNDLYGDTIYPGQELSVPAGRSTHRLAYEVHHGDTLWSIANSFDVSVAQLRSWNDLSRGDLLMPGQVLNIRTDTAAHMVTYEVKRGDSLWSIASRFSVRVADLKNWNSLASDLLHPGQKLRIIVDATG